jgi:hypothetical protein
MQGGQAMRVRTDARADSTVPALPAILTELQNKLSSLKEGWSQQLRQDPSRFGQVEVEVHHTFQALADQVVAGLLGDVGQQPALEDACKKSH